MSDKVGDEFDGFLSGVAPYGLFVDLVEQMFRPRHVTIISAT